MSIDYSQKFKYTGYRDFEKCFQGSQRPMVQNQENRQDTLGKKISNFDENQDTKSTLILKFEENSLMNK